MNDQDARNTSRRWLGIATVLQPQVEEQVNTRLVAARRMGSGANHIESKPDPRFGAKQDQLRESFGRGAR